MMVVSGRELGAWADQQLCDCLPSWLQDTVRTLPLALSLVADRPSQCTGYTKVAWCPSSLGIYAHCCVML